MDENSNNGSAPQEAPKFRVKCMAAIDSNGAFHFDIKGDETLPGNPISVAECKGAVELLLMEVEHLWRQAKAQEQRMREMIANSAGGTIPEDIMRGKGRRT